MNLSRCCESGVNKSVMIKNEANTIVFYCVEPIDTHD